MRQRIDITELEVQTKIRAKYLRALENEEWDLLPGPTYVKSFLRTYGDALGLDGKLLVEEYKLRHEPMETGELHPIRPTPQRERDRRRRGSRGLPRGAIVGGLLLLIVVALFAIGQMSDDGGDTATNVATSPAKTQAREPERTPPSATPVRPRRVRLSVVPTAPVWVCLEDARGQRLIAGEEVSPQTPRRTFRSRRFRVTLGNGSVTLRVNGKTLDVPEIAEPIGYEISRSGKRSTLPADRRPTCA